MNSAFSPRSVPGIEKVSLHGNGLSFCEDKHLSDGECSFHSHEESEVVLFLEGAVEDIRKHQSVLRTSSTLIVLPAGELHAGRVQKGLKLFSIWIEPQWLTRFQQDSSLVETPAAVHEGLPIWLALRLYREFQRRDSLSLLMLEGLTLELLVEIARSSHTPVAGHAPRWLQAAKDFLHARFRESLSLETIANAAGVHPSHLLRGFRQHYRCTPGDYVRRLRVDYACHLLTTSDTPFSQIALETGFSHQSHFCRAFKAMTAMTPAEYQKVSGHRSEAKNECLRQDNH